MRSTSSASKADVARSTIALLLRSSIAAANAIASSARARVERADLAGLHRTYVSSVERGKRNISLLNIEKLALALGVEMTDLMPRSRRR